jgi:signal transduction histidine kinase
LFEPFTQEAQGANRGGGLGLGLAIASRLAKLQNASLSAASAGINKGATFTLSIAVAD